MVKFQGLGGEIGIAKGQVRTILKDGQSDASDFVVPGTGDLPGPAGAEPSPASPSAESGEDAKPRAAAPSDISLENTSVKELRDYQSRIQALTQEIDSLRRRYLLAARGYEADGKAPDSNEVLKAWTAELTSKIKDSVKQPAASYTPQERELSELRQQIESLENRKSQLLQEMNQRGLEANRISEGPDQAR
jgi:hypothetical protein